MPTTTDKLLVCSSVQLKSVYTVETNKGDMVFIEFSFGGQNQTQGFLKKDFISRFLKNMDCEKTETEVNFYDMVLRDTPSHFLNAYPAQLVVVNQMTRNYELLKSNYE